MFGPPAYKYIQLKWVYAYICLSTLLGYGLTLKLSRSQQKPFHTSLNDNAHLERISIIITENEPVSLPTKKYIPKRYLTFWIHQMEDAIFQVLLLCPREHQEIQQRCIEHNFPGYCCRQRIPFIFKSAIQKPMWFFSKREHKKHKHLPSVLNLFEHQEASNSYMPPISRKLGGKVVDV